jgi:hypothetical protein
VEAETDALIVLVQGSLKVMLRLLHQVTRHETLPRHYLRRRDQEPIYQKALSYANFFIKN